jgi:quinol monooxygenase YgiN
MSASPQMLAYEAYGSRNDLYETHLKSAAIQAFLPKIAGLSISDLDLTHFNVESGYLDKPGDRSEVAIFWVTRIVAKDGKRDVILQRLAKLAEYVKKHEDETWTFQVLRSLDNETDIRIFERYKTRKALEAHMSSKEVVDTFVSSKDITASIEGRGYTPNGAGWLHK